MLDLAIEPSLAFGIIVGAAILLFFLGLLMGRWLRMPEHGWKLGVIFGSIAMAAALVLLQPIKQGIDLRGGVILIYQVDEEETKNATSLEAEVANADADGRARKSDEPTIRMADLITALNRRINPGGVREVVIRPYGDKQVEIIIPDVDDSEVEEIKKNIATQGFLKFRIVAHRDRNRYEWDLAEKSLESPDKKVAQATLVKDDSGKVIGEWVRLGREDRPKSMPEGVLPKLRFEREQIAQMLTRELEPGVIETFVLVDDPRFNVEGRHLWKVEKGFDQQAQPCVNFTMTSEGSQLFQQLTSTNLPNEADIRAPLGIIMDGEMLSAPGIKSTISNSGVIEGKFTEDEVKFLVSILNAGKLPAVLEEDPISQNKISPLLGQDTIRKGAFAISASVIAVLIFMLVYYRFSGIVACLALIANLVLIVGIMILIKASLSLPGLAGLVLTVGMSVDANVLIFERIREELRRGAALRMAIRNGFARATSTIVDANLTTLITAVVLYVVGTETIKGFAITLIIGILMSMFTAIFCSRVVFEIAERKKWITSLGMTQILGETNIDFIGKRGIAAVLSGIAIVASVAAVVTRGVDMLDIDFTGGTSVQVVLNEPTDIADVRAQLDGIADSFSVTEVNPVGYQDDTVYKIDTSLDTEKKLEAAVAKFFEGELKTHVMEFTLGSANQQSSQTNATNVELVDQSSSLDGLLLARSQEAQEAVDSVVETPSESTEGSKSDSETTSNEDDDADEKTAPALDAADNADSNPPSAGNSDFTSSAELNLDQKLGKSAVEKMLVDAAKRAGVIVTSMKVSNPEWESARAERGFDEWDVQFSTSAADAEKVLGSMRDDFATKPVFLSSSKIGSKVAGDMKSSASMAIVVSLLGIVGYIWIRFQRVGFGLAAVLALVHDVIITLGAVALSFYLANGLGFLLIDEFKISLPIVAAFLTIIGYSLNDTIVVFDRIREVKGKSPELTTEMVNRSINQTLSRTLLTSITTLIVVVILYVFGGQGIHGFAFALLVGVLVGTYSSIFVASPALLWLIGKSETKKSSKTREKVEVS